MRLLLIGAPGAGKGTQAVRLAAHFRIAHISSGELLREHIAAGSAIGRAAQSYVSGGDLVPDNLVIDMLRSPVVAAAERGGYVLDGFPRTVDQAEAAHEMARELGVAIQVAAYLDVPRDALVQRLLARGRGADDTPEVITHRLDVFGEMTRPMLDYYAEGGRLVVVDGSGSVDMVTSSLLVPLREAQRLLDA